MLIAAPTGVAKKTNEAFTIPYTPLVIPLMMWLISYQHHQLCVVRKTTNTTIE
jgi:hypothetical protein